MFQVFCNSIFHTHNNKSTGKRNWYNITHAWIIPSWSTIAYWIVYVLVSLSFLLVVIVIIAIIITIITPLTITITHKTLYLFQIFQLYSFCLHLISMLDLVTAGLIIDHGFVRSISQSHGTHRHCIPICATRKYDQERISIRYDNDLHTGCYQLLHLRHCLPRLQITRSRICIPNRCSCSGNRI